MIYKLLRPFLFLSGAEQAHNRILRLGHALGASGAGRILGAWYAYSDPRLRTSLWGLQLPNPVGIAAGFDKDGVLRDFLPALGVGFVEIGTVTPLPQIGNPKPRLFRIPQDEAIINRMGFNGAGMDAVAENLSRARIPAIVGINIGKNKATPLQDAVRDYEKCFARLADAASFLVVNVSSPNTPHLRELQNKEPLKALLRTLQGMNRALPREKPLLLKIAPDLSDSQLDDIIEIVRETGLAGIIAVNTTTSREHLSVPQDLVYSLGEGGLSGRPLKRRATEVLRYLYKKSGGTIPLIGVGGIFTGRDAYERIRAGASLVELYTSLVYEGPEIVMRIKQDLARCLKRDGFKSVADAVGVDVR